MKGKYAKSADYLRSLEIMRRKALLTTIKPVTKPLSDPVSCKLLMDGDKLEAKRVQEKLAKEAKISDVFDYGILEKTKDCEDYRKVMGFYDKPQSEEEKNFPLAFTMRMHKKVTYEHKRDQCKYLSRKLTSV